MFWSTVLKTPFNTCCACQ